MGVFLKKVSAAANIKTVLMSGTAAMGMIIAGAASAADFSLPMKAPPPVPYASWSGLYIGAAVGYGWGRDSTTEYLTGAGTFTGLKWNYPTSGVVGGLFAGGNYQIGSTVLGLEADFEGTGVKGGFYDPPVGGAGDTKINWQGSIRGRLGYASDKVMIYGTGGLAYADIGHSNQNLIANTSESISAVRTGWTAGGGIEYAYTRNILMRAEYRFTDFGKYRYDSLVTFPGLSADQTPTLNTVRVGVAYKF